MAKPSTEDLIKDLFFVKKAKDEAVKHMDKLANDFDEIVGSPEQYMQRLSDFLDRLSLEDRHFALNLFSRHERVMIIFTRMICCIEEVLNE